MRRSLVVVVSAAVLLGGVSGCSQQTAGRAVADGSSATGAPATGEPTKSSSPRTTTSEPGNASLDALDPCEILSESQRTALGVTGEAQPEKFPSSNFCQWQVDNNPAVPDGYSLGVAVFPKLGIDKVNAVGEKKPVTVGSRRAIESFGAGGSVCAISIEVTATSRVDVQASGGRDAALCAAAMDAAKVVEPELP